MVCIFIGNPMNDYNDNNRRQSYKSIYRELQTDILQIDFNIFNNNIRPKERELDISQSKIDVMQLDKRIFNVD